MKPLNEKQQHVVDCMVKGVTTNCQQLLLCIGGPGTGKTFMVNRLDYVLKQLGSTGIKPTAFMGVAAANFPGASTICTMFSINPTHALGKKTLKPLDIADRRRLKLVLGNPDIIVVDEVSTLTPDYMSHIDQRLRELYIDDKLFGAVDGRFLPIATNSTYKLVRRGRQESKSFKRICPKIHWIPSII